MGKPILTEQAPVFLRRTPGVGRSGGAVNQVSKLLRRFQENEVAITLCSGGEVRGTADLNVANGANAALRFNAMGHTAGNHGAKVDKIGLAPTFRWGIGTGDEFLLGYYSSTTATASTTACPGSKAG